jgi:hypothetical protein
MHVENDKIQQPLFCVFSFSLCSPFVSHQLQQALRPFAAAEAFQMKAYGAPHFVANQKSTLQTDSVTTFAAFISPRDDEN